MIDHFEEYEGRVDHFYLDGENNVTVGVGCLIADPAFLTVQMYKRTTSIAASYRDLMNDFNAVKALEAGKDASYYGKVCQLYMNDKDINILFQQRLDKILKELRAVVTLPKNDDAVLAILDMAFTLGAHGLKTKFPKFIAAFEAGDYATCALECEREKIQPSRNLWTITIFEKL